MMYRAAWICLSLLLVLLSEGVQAQTDCNLLSVSLRYGLSQPPELNPSTGAIITLTCVSTPGMSDFIWLKNGQRTINPSSSMTYTLPSITADDGGVYQCGVNFTACDMTIYSNEITINTEPKISLLVGESTVMEGEVLSLSCLAQGWPTPTIAWHFNGVQVHQGQTYTLTMASPANEGLYTCQASNSRGMDRMNHTLSVTALPSTTTVAPLMTTTQQMDMTTANEPTTTSMSGSTDGTTQPTLSSEQTDNVNMGLTTTAASTLLPETPFIVILAVSAFLALGVVIIFIIMGCMCCSEVCRLYRRRAKARRDRLNSDEISLLPAQRSQRESKGTEGIGYGNKTDDEPKSGPSSMGFKDDINGPDLSARNSSEITPHSPTATVVHSSQVQTQRFFGKRSKSSDKEQLISPQDISLDDSQGSKHKKKQKKNEGKKTRAKSEIVGREHSDDAHRPLSMNGGIDTQKMDSKTDVLVDIPQKLPLSAASMASPTVTAVIKAQDKGQVVMGEGEGGVRTTSIVISEKTGETTVAMEQEEFSSDDDEWDTSRSIYQSKPAPPTGQDGSDPNMTSMPVSVVAEKAKRLGRTSSYVELLSRSHPMNLAEVSELVYGTENNGRSHPLFEEYKSVPSNSVQSLQLLPKESAKNRYRNVLPNPHSNVRLNDLGTPGSTYINANYIRGYADRERTYIASQGPKFETMADFWRMVWEQNVSIVVMITGIIERGTVRGDKKTKYGSFAVTNNFEEKTASCNISYLSIRNEATGAEEREVYHFWCTTWPDFGVPKETGSILKLRQMVDDYRNQGVGGPLLVHCSAGLGRTGTFVAIDMGIQQYESEAKVDPLKYLCEMRQDRGGIIQTPEQYLFVHNALADYMATRPK